jgi:hypothetical protein
MLFLPYLSRQGADEFIEALRTAQFEMETPELPGNYQENPLVSCVVAAVGGCVFDPVVCACNHRASGGVIQPLAAAYNTTPRPGRQNRERA